MSTRPSAVSGCPRLWIIQFMPPLVPLCFEPPPLVSARRPQGSTDDGVHKAGR